MPLATPSRRAVIDVGSNTIKLLVADVSGGVVAPVLERSEYARLAEGMGAGSRAIAPAAALRALQALRDLAAAATAAGATRIDGVATSALRTADNAADFLARAAKETGIAIQVISGEEEARLIFAGISSTPELSSTPLLAMDLGGGSAEWISGKSGVIEDRVSLDVGCVRTTEAHMRSYPPSPEAIRSLKHDLAETLAPVFSRFSSANRTFVGTGGTFTAMAAALQPDFWKRSSEGHTFRFESRDFATLTDRLSSMTLVEFQEKSGIPANRADIIVAGAITLTSTLESFGVTAFAVSTRNLRFGWLSSRSGSDILTSRGREVDCVELR